MVVEQLTYGAARRAWFTEHDVPRSRHGRLIPAMPYLGEARLLDQETVLRVSYEPIGAVGSEGVRLLDKKATAMFAVNHIKINWKKQAVLSAKAYLKMGSGFSRTGLIDQLSSKAGDQYTLAQATYAANHVGF